MAYFHSLAVQTGLNDSALISTLHRGLSRKIGHVVALREEQGTLDEAFKLAIRLDD